MTGAKTLGLNLASTLKVGGFVLSGRAFLAPMAGVTDPTMRRIARRYGASAAVSEMIYAGGLARGDRETVLRLADSGDGPRVIQIAARDEGEIERAARAAQDAGADWVDINMGCPCKRVTGGLAGSALMRDLDQATRLIAAAMGVLRVPLSVKMRLGWDSETQNAAELARRAEAEGVRLVTIHGRTRQQFYSGRADWRAIGAVKAAVSIPVIANGDCAGLEDAARMLAESAADGVMVGRAAQGRPWLVGDIAHFLETGERRKAPDLAERAKIAREHIEGLMLAMGVVAGLRHARKHLAAYIDHAPGANVSAEARRELLTTETASQALRLIDQIFAPGVETASAYQEAAA